MTTTTSFYTTLSHAYPTEIACPNPATCTDKTHWSASNDDEIDTLAEIRDLATNYDDAPAIRIIRKTVVVEEVVVEVIDQAWTAEEIAAAR